MIDAQAFIKSPVFEEVRDSIVFLKTLEPVTVEIMLGGKPKRCVPLAKTIAERLAKNTSEIQRQIDRLVQLQWARKYKEGNKVLYVVGTVEKLFMTSWVGLRFSQAKRKKNGRVRQTEWRWLPITKWTGVTVWSMVTEKFRDQGIFLPKVPATMIWRLKMLTTLCSQVGSADVKTTADYFEANYEALKKGFKWYGFPTPQLFKGFYQSIKDARVMGLPQTRRYAHDRTAEDAKAAAVVTEEWQSL